MMVAHAPGMPGSFSPAPDLLAIRDAVMHVGIANLRWRGKRSRHSRRIRNPRFYVSGKSPIINLTTT